MNISSSTTSSDLYTGGIMTNNHNKHFSILGDSISTLEGYNPPGYYEYYTLQDADLFGVASFEDTYWGMLINYLDGKLLVNDSYSGACVVKQKGWTYDFPSGISDKRIDNLEKGGIVPDVIIVAMGANDYFFDKPLYGEGNDLTSFYEAYKAMLHKLRSRYKDAEIWSLTYPNPSLKFDGNFELPENGIDLVSDEYNQVIRKVVREFNDDKIILLDLFGLGRKYESLDGAHPTKKGMQQIFEMIVECLRDS